MSSPNPKSNNSGQRGRPYLAGVLIALGVGAVTTAIPLIPGANEALQWVRETSFPGSLLGWLSGHFTHWSWDHLLWDLAAFLFLSFAALRLIPNRYLPCLLLAAVVIPLEIALNQLHLSTYRGLSGIDSALFGLIIAGLWQTGNGTEASPLPKILAFLGTVGFLGKCLFELWTGQTLFVSSVEAGFITVVSAHVTGFLCGAVAGSISSKRFLFRSPIQTASLGNRATPKIKVCPLPLPVDDTPNR